MLCFECPLKAECRETCEDVEAHLESQRDYKTTYKNKERSLTPFDQERSRLFSDESTMPERDHLKSIYVELIPQIMEIIHSCDLTDRQLEIVLMHWEDGLSTSEIGRQLGISQQSVYQALYGHPKHGGGALRKIRAAVSQHPELSSYM